MTTSPLFNDDKVPYTQSKLPPPSRLSSPPPPPSSAYDFPPSLPPIPQTHNDRLKSFANSDHYRTSPLPLPPLPPEENEDEHDFASFESSLNDGSFSSASDPSAFDNNEDNEHDLEEQKLEAEQDLPSFESSSDDSFSSSSETPFNWPFKDISEEISTSLAALQTPSSPPLAVPNSPSPSKHVASSSPTSFIQPPKSPTPDGIPASPTSSASSLADEDLDGSLPSPLVAASHFDVQTLPEATTPPHVLSPTAAVSSPVTSDHSEFQALSEAVTPPHVLSPKPVVSPPVTPDRSESETLPEAVTPPFHTLSSESAESPSKTTNQFEVQTRTLPERRYHLKPPVFPPVTTNGSEFQPLPEAVAPLHIVSSDSDVPPPVTTNNFEVRMQTLPERRYHMKPPVFPPVTTNHSEFQPLPEAVAPLHVLSSDSDASPPVTTNAIEARTQTLPERRYHMKPAVLPPVTINHSGFQPLPEAATPSHILPPDSLVFPPVTANHSEVQTLPEAVSPSHILSPEPDTVAEPYSPTSFTPHREGEDADVATLQQRPVYVEEYSDTPLDTNSDLQYDSDYSPVELHHSPSTSETSEQDEFDSAAIRVPHGSGRSSNSEHVAHWSSSDMSDTSSIMLSNHMPAPESNGSSTSLSDSYQSSTPPKTSYLSGNQTPCPPRHASKVNGGNPQSFEQQQGPSPAPSLSGSTQKTYSMSSNFSSTSSLPHTPQTSLPQTQPPMSGQNPLSQAHLKPGNNASLLSYKKTLEMYRMQARKMSGDLEIQFEFAVFLLGVGGKISSIKDGGDDNEEGDLVDEGCRILKRLSAQGHAAAQYYLATCYINGVGSNKQDWAKAFPLLKKASKHNHPDAAYLVARCYASGKGVKRDGSRALQYYKKSAASAHPGAMYALGMAFLTGNLAVLDSMTPFNSQNPPVAPPPLPIRPAPRDGVKWLKRACGSATPDFSDALFELAKLHEQGIDNVVFVDLPYAVALYTRAGELGHVRSMYRLGECYEFGKLGCELDPRRSIGWYQAAAENGHADSCFAMTAWYLSGHPGLIPQNSTEAFHWAFKAAELGHPKATYATAYFMETGMGVEKDMESAMKWYRIAADLGDTRAIERLTMGDASTSSHTGGMVGDEQSDHRRRRKGDDCSVM